MGGVFLESGEWQQNKAGFYFSKYYGFGLMDAGRMVNLAKNWTQVPRQRKCEIVGSERYMQVFILPTPFSFAYTAGHMKYSKAIGLTVHGRGPRFRCIKIFSRDSLRPYM